MMDGRYGIHHHHLPRKLINEINNLLYYKYLLQQSILQFLFIK